MFDVLHWVKAAFKKHALDDIKESDCLNREAFRCVRPLPPPAPLAHPPADCACAPLRVRARELTARRYHDTTSSFAALATQSAMLSQSASALFDRDHPSMAGKGAHGLLFRELAPAQLAALRGRVGLKEWAEPADVKPQ